ncbi:MAG: hypothetical protein Q9184_006132, partial [Pyrenodesmia sp. 2 TL-2023]
MHANFPRQTRRQAPGITKPLFRLPGLDDADTATISARFGRVASVAGIINADLVWPCTLDISDAAAEDELGFGAETDLLDRDAREGFAYLAVGAGSFVGCQRAGSFTGARAEFGVLHFAVEGGGGLDADFLFGALRKLGEAAKSWLLCSG